MSEFMKSVAAMTSNSQSIRNYYFPASVKFNSITRHMLADVLIIYDIIAVFFSGLAARFLYLSFYKETQTIFLDYVSLILLVAIAYHFIARQKGLYSVDKVTNFYDQLESIIYACLTTFALAFFVLFFLKISDRYSRVWFAEWSVFFLIALGAGRALIARQFERLARNGSLRRSVALIGTGAQFEQVKEMILRDERYFSLVTVCNTSSFCEDSHPGHGERLATFTNEARESDVDEVLIALPGTQVSWLEPIVQQIQMLPVDVNILPDFGGAKIPFMRLQQAGNMAVITTISKPIASWGALLKNIEDHIIALAGLFLAAPVMAVIAIAIKLDSDGPVFFRQRRHGYNHRVIEVMKFRTMTVMEDGDVVAQATKNDRRVTKVGRFLRRTSLDELPQMINVLRGEMSIVGPRPHALAHNNYYSDFVENYANRHRVKPGITGWAQVHGYRGEIDNPEKMAERVRYDLQYIDNWSIWLDFKIIIMTPFFGLFRKSAY